MVVETEVYENYYSQTESDSESSDNEAVSFWGPCFESREWRFSENKS